MDPAGWGSSLFLLLFLRQTDVETDADKTGRQGRKEAAGAGPKEGGGNGFGVFGLRGDQVTWKLGLWRAGPWLCFEGQAPDKGR